MGKYIWELKVKIKVHKDWVADGFEATPERIKALIEDHLLPYAEGHEKQISVKTISKPHRKDILKEQGY
jgi:hypothetical protein